MQTTTRTYEEIVMKKIFKIWQSGTNTWFEEPTIYEGTLLGAKQYASKHCLSEWMSTTICNSEDEPICQRKYWEGLTTFGWHNWKNCLFHKYRDPSRYEMEL